MVSLGVFLLDNWRTKTIKRHGKQQKSTAITMVLVETTIPCTLRAFVGHFMINGQSKLPGHLGGW